MPNRYLRALWAPVLAVVLTAFVPAAAQGADDVVAELRIVGPDGSMLEPGTSYVTNTERIKTDRKAKCFIDGEGGSGDTVRLAGPTAMGLIETAGDANADVDPLSVTDEFGFGLGLCSIGDVGADASNFWSLTINHQSSQVGGDQASLSDGDEVLWFLTEFPPPPELQLTAQPGAEPGSITVHVDRWTCSTDFPPPDPVCESDVASGVAVNGGDAPVQTNGSGDATVSLANAGNYTLQAAGSGDLSSNLAPVCVSTTEGECPPDDAPIGRSIVGRRVADDFAATAGWDAIKAKGGNDRIDASQGGADRINCGGGRDRVVVSGTDDDVAGNCEKVKQPIG